MDRPHFTYEELKDARLEWGGTRKDIRYLIACSVREPSDYMNYDKAWCTYVLLSPEQHEKLKPILNDAPWNGGQTYYRKHSMEFMDASPDLKAKWDGHWFRMGDDFQHSWDDGRHDYYDLAYMRNHIEQVIDFLAEGGAGE